MTNYTRILSKFSTKRGNWETVHIFWDRFLSHCDLKKKHGPLTSGGSHSQTTGKGRILLIVRLRLWKLISIGGLVVKREGAKILQIDLQTMKLNLLGSFGETNTYKTRTSLTALEKVYLVFEKKKNDQTNNWTSLKLLKKTIKIQMIATNNNLREIEKIYN